MFLTQDDRKQLQLLSKDDTSYQTLVKLFEDKLTETRQIIDDNPLPIVLPDYQPDEISGTNPPLLQNEAREQQAKDVIQRVVENSTDLIQRINLEGRFLYVNPALATLWNVAPEDIIGKTNDELGFTGKLAEDFDLARRYVYETGLEQEIEFSLEFEGENTTYRAKLIPEFDNNGEVETILAIARDISHVKRQQRAILRYRDLLRKAHEVSGVGSWEANLATGETFWSDEFFRICGLEPGSLEPTTEIGFSIIHPDDRERAGAAVTRSMEEDAPYFIEKRIVHPDGTVCWVESRGEFVLDEASGTQKLIGTFLDITERKQIEPALQESEERYRSILSAMVEGVVLHDKTGKIVMCNDAVTEITGLSREQLIDNHDDVSKWEILTAEGDPYPQEEFPSFISLRTGQAQSNTVMSFYHTKTEEQRWIRVNTRPLINQDNEHAHGVVATFYDITDERHANENRLRAAVESERRRLLAQFIQMASHEFRTPLAVIGTNAYLLGRLQDEQQRKEKVKVINWKIKQLNHLIDMQLLLTKLDSGIEMNFVAVQIAPLISQVIQKLNNKIQEKGLSVEVKIMPDDLAAHIDIHYFDKVIYELLDNAICYSEQDGTIHICAVNEDSRVIISVKDNGSGISSEELPHVFDRFWRKDKMHTESGLGLGLSLAEKIVELHHGKITVESQRDKGSEFKITLLS